MQATANSQDKFRYRQKYTGDSMYIFFKSHEPEEAASLAMLQIFAAAAPQIIEFGPQTPCDK